MLHGAGLAGSGDSRGDLQYELIGQDDDREALFEALFKVKAARFAESAA